MNLRSRLLTQSAFLVLSLCVFFGFTAQRHIVAFYHGLHFFSSLSALPWLMLPPLGLFTLTVTAALLFVTLMAGRFYCSRLCPAGFIQDLSCKLGRVLRVKGRPAGDWTGVRFFVLAMSLSFLALRSSAYLYFDHFSNLGRVYGLANAIKAGGPFGWNFALGLGFLAVLVLVPLIWPRWFCGALCPSGTIFMLLSKAGKRMAHVHKPIPAQGGLSRRDFMAATGLSILGAGCSAWIKRRFLAPRRNAFAIPPGGRSAEQFLERCVACDTCVSVCPTKVLAPAGREIGLAGLAKVRLEYGRSYCSYECNACLGVCPSGAISYFPLEAKKRIRIGQSRLIKAICIPFTSERDCGACQEQCPTGAITMEPFGARRVPVLHEDYCIGCGSCQFACPAQPRQAIVVDGVDPHSFAAAPVGARGKKGRPTPAPESPAFPF